MTCACAQGHLPLLLILAITSGFSREAPDAQRIKVYLMNVDINVSILCSRTMCRAGSLHSTLFVTIKLPLLTFCH
jgi:hypothetical protein